MDNDSAVRWIFDGTSWTTEKSVFLKDKNQEHTFYAYYPHSGSKAESKENIKMPSLDSQNGDVYKRQRQNSYCSCETGSTG